jgi:hypothetical protein
LIEQTYFNSTNTALHNIMAFFGLTALGPHPFTSLEVNSPTLHLFTENDLKIAWNKSDGEGKYG